MKLGTCLLRNSLLQPDTDHGDSDYFRFHFGHTARFSATDLVTPGPRLPVVSSVHFEILPRGSAVTPESTCIPGVELAKAECAFLFLGP